MPRRLFVCTPSKIAAYADCPRRYRFTYRDRPAPPRGPAWAHNSLGASVHTALRNWWDLPPERRSSESVAKLLKATWVREGYRDTEQELSAFRQSLTWIEGYLSALPESFEPVAVERTVAAKTAVLAFSGRTDRIDRRDAELVIVDYKTGRRPLTGDDARGSQALALYAFAAARTFRTACRRVELHHLPTGTIAAHEHTEESIARQVGRAEAAARDIQAAEQAVDDGASPDEAFPTRPGMLCSWCDFRRVCADGVRLPEKEPWAAIEF